MQPKKSLKNNISRIAVIVLLLPFACTVKHSPSVDLSTEQSKLEVFSQVRKKWAGIQSLQGYFRVTADFKGKQGSLKALLALSLPDNLRMELMSPGGTTMAVLTLSEGMIRLYYPSDDVYFFGASEPANIQKVLGINMKPEEMLPLFIGMGFDLTKTPDRFIAEDGELIAEFSSIDKEILFRLSLDPDAVAVNGITAMIFDSGKIFAKVQYKDMVYRNNFAYPRLANIVFPEEDSSFKIRITNAQFLVKKLDAKVFTVTPKETARKYQIEDLKVKGTLLFGDK